MNNEDKEIDFYIEIWKKNVAYKKKVRGILLYDGHPEEEGDLDASFATYYDEVFKEWNVVKIFSGITTRSFSTLEEAKNWVCKFLKEKELDWYIRLCSEPAIRRAERFQKMEVIK